MRKDIMVDIETLGKGLDASIFQIGAVSFDIETGKIYDEINLIGDIEKYSELNVDGDTLKWWLNTDKELLTKLLNAGTMSEWDLIRAFEVWLYNQADDMKDVYLWGNGILFDNAKIQHNMEKNPTINGYPIFYKNDRDVRTILELASQFTGLSEADIKKSVESQEEVAHDALDDCKYQIRLVHKCHNLLMRKEEQKSTVMTKVFTINGGEIHNVSMNHGEVIASKAELDKIKGEKGFITSGEIEVDKVKLDNYLSSLDIKNIIKEDNIFNERSDIKIKMSSTYGKMGDK